MTYFQIVYLKKCIMMVINNNNYVIFIIGKFELPHEDKFSKFRQKMF